MNMQHNYETNISSSKKPIYLPLQNQFILHETNTSIFIK